MQKKPCCYDRTPRGSGIIVQDPTTIQTTAHYKGVIKDLFRTRINYQYNSVTAWAVIASTAIKTKLSKYTHVRTSTERGPEITISTVTTPTQEARHTDECATHWWTNIAWLIPSYRGESLTRNNGITTPAASGVHPQPSAPDSTTWQDRWLQEQLKQ